MSASSVATPAFGAAFNVPISGEIERISLSSPNDPWSAGEMVVGGQTVIIPRNLLVDLPANRLTLQQIFAQAPAACLAAGESGLAKADTCNSSGAGGFVTLSANRVASGNVIAGDVFIEKGRELVTGVVTYINYDQGYFRMNGTPGSDTTGVMVRINDPTSRHTIQNGLGCGIGAPNCSPDPRFTLDPDNYTNVFATGYPLCIPSTVARPFAGLPGIPGVLTVPAGTAQSGADGTGDLLCPSANRTPAAVTEPAVADSRRFAPIVVGDHVVAEGNFETVNAVRFLSAHTTNVSKGLTTRADASQPDYIFLAEVEMDAPGFQNQRARSLIIGFATQAPDVLLWTVHYDPVANAPHEKPWASVRGCDAVGGAGSCGSVGLVGVNNIWKIRHDVDFNAVQNKKPELNPCEIINAESRFGTFCDPASLAAQFSVLSPTPHEIMARTGKKLANPALATVDINGAEATNGEYLFPFGVNLGGIGFPEMNEVDLNALGLPFSFSGIPWNLDRRLSPGGCIGACENVPMPLDPFPFEEIDPRILAAVPAPAQILSFFPFGAGNTLDWPPAAPGLIDIVPTPPMTLVCTGGGAATQNQPPVVSNDTYTMIRGGMLNVAAPGVLSNDSDPDAGDTLNAAKYAKPATGTLAGSADGGFSYTPPPTLTGMTKFSYLVKDSKGLASPSAGFVSIAVRANRAPLAANDTAVTPRNTPLTINVLGNDSDPDTAIDPSNRIDPATVFIPRWTQPDRGGAVAVNADGTIRYAPAPGFSGTETFTYAVRDTYSTPGISKAATVTVNVQ
ncbi:MAG: Ig-like domain-containing protein [Sideroxyarcus sp.]|nr:Ig-like domain-containing protein [Sideroxyarcus sp.]